VYLLLDGIFRLKYVKYSRLHILLSIYIFQYGSILIGVDLALQVGGSKMFGLHRVQ